MTYKSYKMTYVVYSSVTLELVGSHEFRGSAKRSRDTKTSKGWDYLEVSSFDEYVALRGVGESRHNYEIRV